MSETSCFIVRRLHFRFRALDAVSFPAGAPANILRGAFGTLFRQLVCRCQTPHEPDCPYARIFEPSRPSGPGPSGLADHPRPFVFRAAHLDGRQIAPGELFDFGVNLFTAEGWPVPYFETVFAQLGTAGLGPNRGRAVLESFSESILELGFAPIPAGRVTVEFLAPTELKGAETPVPAFGSLLARLRDRISNLGAQYGRGPLTLDFRAFAERAGQVSVESSALEWVEARRKSSRTGQTHPLSGFTGAVTYAGPLDEFMPYLEIGCHTGVGRQTVWGKGEYRLSLGHSSKK